MKVKCLLLTDELIKNFTRTEMRKMHCYNNNNNYYYY